MRAGGTTGCGGIGAVSELESLSHDELLVLAREQAATIARQDAQLSATAVQLDEVMARFEETAGRLVKLEHLLSRNSSNSSL